MTLKKIIINSLFFAITVIGLYLLAILILVKVKTGGTPLVYRTSDVINWKGGNSYQKFIDFNKNSKYDIIVVGSSHAYRGYDPRIFKNNGINLFNLGTSAQSVFNSYYIAKNYITSSNCKLVILELYDGALSSNALEPTSDLVQNISSDKAAMEMAIALKDPRAINMLSVRMLTKTTNPMYKDSAYIMNGYSEKRDSVKTIDNDWYNSKPQINDLQITYLHNLLEYLKSNNISVLLVTHPAPKETNNGNHNKFNTMINSIAREYGVEYWDFSFDHNLNSMNHFYDGHHLNQSGVTLFNDMLIQKLKQTNYIKMLIQ